MSYQDSKIILLNQQLSLALTLLKPELEKKRQPIEQELNGFRCSPQTLNLIVNFLISIEKTKLADLTKEEMTRLISTYISDKTQERNRLLAGPNTLQYAVNRLNERINFFADVIDGQADCLNH